MDATPANSLSPPNPTAQPTLAARAHSGDIEALSLLIEQHRVSLFRIAFAELHRYDDAQDAVAEAIVRACRHAARHAPVRNFLPWMHRIVRNEARRLRSRAAQRGESALSLAESLPDARQTAGDTLALEVRLALRRLPVDQARAMAMYYLDGQEVATVAAALGRPVGTVKWMLSRGRANLAQLLEGYETMETNDAGNNSPLEQLPTPRKPRRAALAAPSLTPEYQRELSDALIAAGWEEIYVVPSADEILLRFTRPDNGAFALPSALEDCEFVVLDERIGRASAFEVLPLLAAARRRRDFALLLLLDAGRGPAETDTATLSAYVTGVDMLLTKPFATAEFVSFAARILKGMSELK